MRLAVKHFVHGDAALLSNGVGIAELAECKDCGLDEVVGVGGAFGLSEDVGDTYSLEDSAHSTATGETSTLGGGLEENLGAAEVHGLLVRESSVDDGNADEVLLSGLSAFGDGGGYFASLAETHADDAFAVAYDDDGCEAEGASALGNLGYSVDSDEAILEFKVVGVSYSIKFVCHRD